MKNLLLYCAFGAAAVAVVKLMGKAVDYSDQTALARMLASEVGGAFKGQAGIDARIAVGNAALNVARARGKSVYQILVPPGKTYGPQTDGRYASTKADPSKLDNEIATGLLAGKYPDTTGGAVQWDAPRAQRAALARGVKGYKKTPEDVAAMRKKEGKKVVLVAGIPEDSLRLWRKA